MYHATMILSNGKAKPLPGGFMRVYSKDTIINAILLAMFENTTSKNHYRFYIDVQQMDFDRYGVKITFVLRDGSILSGRLSNKHNFTGSWVKDNKTVSFRSYRAVKHTERKAS